MNKLNSIMEGLSKTEYDIIALEYVLKSMEFACTEEEQLEMGYVINVIGRNLRALKEDIHTTISDLDLYIVGADTEK